MLSSELARTVIGNDTVSQRKTNKWFCTKKTTLLPKKKIFGNDQEERSDKGCWEKAVRAIFSFTRVYAAHP